MGFSVALLSRLTSDHSPLLLQVSFAQYTGSWPVRFQDMWHKRADFIDIVQTVWKSGYEGFGMFWFTIKLRALKKSLREWNIVKVGNVFRNLREAEKSVKSLK